eukprot:scaffold2352_cov64-Cylindrotheca_fusiformis.AAC.1
MISPWILRSTTQSVSKFVPTSFSKSLQKTNTSSRGRRRWLSVASSSIDDEPRESMAFDVLIVGGGPSGLSASIKLKQLNPDLSVCVMDKGSEIGSHIVSGNVFDPIAMQELFPSTENFDWRSEFEDSQGASATAVTKDQFTILTETS